MANTRILVVAVILLGVAGTLLLWIGVVGAPASEPPRLMPPQGDFATRFQPVPPPNTPPNTAAPSGHPATPRR